MQSDQCVLCKWFMLGGNDFKCYAFPDGIPGKILMGKFDHSNPYKGDNGFRWEKRTDKGLNEKDIEKIIKRI